jgi:ElaB/YqjD/DUF883 family membrane-anchored ribosome-binding protein
MEVYFKDLISEDASLEKLVDDLSRVVQGADDFAKAIGEEVPEHTRREVAGKLDHLKARCQSLKNQAMAGAKATDKIVRTNPYASLAVIFGLGLFLGARLLRKR